MLCDPRGYQHVQGLDEGDAVAVAVPPAVTIVAGEHASEVVPAGPSGYEDAVFKSIDGHDSCEGPYGSGAGFVAGDADHVAYDNLTLRLGPLLCRSRSGEDDGIRVVYVHEVLRFAVLGELVVHLEVDKLGPLGSEALRRSVALCVEAHVREQLQGGDDGVALQRSVEDAEFNRAAIAEVDGLIAVVVVRGPRLFNRTSFRVSVYDADDLRAAGPAVQLVALTAGELHERVPVPVYEHEHVGDGLTAGSFAVAQLIAAHVYVEPTGTGIVGLEAVLLCDGSDMPPLELVRVVLQRAGVSDDFKTGVKGAVGLHVHVGAGICDGTDGGVAILVRALVHFELKAEEQICNFVAGRAVTLLAGEGFRVRLVPVSVDGVMVLFTVSGIVAARAQVLVPALVPHDAAVGEELTAFTAGVVAVAASFAHVPVVLYVVAVHVVREPLAAVFTLPIV